MLTEDEETPEEKKDQKIEGIRVVVFYITIITAFGLFLLWSR